MTRTIALASILAMALAACGKKEETAPPATANPASPNSSIESLVSTPSPPPPAVTPAQTDAAPQSEPPQGNWFSRKTTAEKQEIMEGWLYQYQSKDPKAKAGVLEQIELSKLSSADRAQLEALRVRLKYPPIPIK